MALPQPSTLSVGDALDGDAAGRVFRRRIHGWRLASFASFALAWEIAGRIPINPAFPPFTETAAALVRMIGTGALPLASVSTLQPLLLGLVISASLGVLL